METKDVWLLLAGAVPGYVINLTATFTAPSVGTAFGKLKSGFIERNKARALAANAEVRDLKSGERDKYLYAINHWGFISLLNPHGPRGPRYGIRSEKSYRPDSFYQPRKCPSLLAACLSIHNFFRVPRCQAHTARSPNSQQNTHCLINNVTGELTVRSGTAIPNRIGVADGRTDQHGYAARDHSGGGRPLSISGADG
jgi:hypothetical protein